MAKIERPATEHRQRETRERDTVERAKGIAERKAPKDARHAQEERNDIVRKRLMGFWSGDVADG